MSNDVLHVIIHLKLKEVVYQVDEKWSSLRRMSRIKSFIKFIMYLRGFGLWLASRYSLKAVTPARPSGPSKPRLGFSGRTPDLDNACVPNHQQVSPNRWLSLLTRSHLKHHNSEPSCERKSSHHLLCTEPPLVLSLLPIGQQINAKYWTEALVTSYYFLRF